MTTTLKHSPANSLVYNSWEAREPWLCDLPLDQIEADPANERPATELLPELLGDLMQSMRELGLQERVKVYGVGPNRFRLSSGHRRHAAALALGWATIPAIVEPAPVGADVDIARIAANLCRRDLDAVSLARGIQALLLAHPDLTQAAVGAMLGKSQGAIANTLRLLDLPADILALLEAGKLTAGHGLELLRIKEPPRRYWDGELTGKSVADEQARYAQRAVGEGQSVAYLRMLIDAHIRDQAQALANGERKREQEAQGRAGALERGADVPALTPEEQAAVDAATARRAEQAAKDQVAAARKDDRLAERASWANAAIDQALGWQDAAPMNLEVLRVAAVAALTGAERSDYSYIGPISHEERKALLADIDAARDIPELLAVLGRIGRAALGLDPEQRALYHNPITTWADARWGLSVRVADALLARKLIQANSYKTLTEGKPKPPPKTAAEVAPTCPGCRHPLRLAPAAPQFYICDSPGGCECPWTLDLEPVLLVDFYAAIDAARGQP